MKPTQAAKKPIVPKQEARTKKATAAPTPEQVEVDSVVYRIPLGQLCGALPKSDSSSDEVAALRTDFAVSPTQRFTAALRENRPALESATPPENQPDAKARALLAVRVARDLDLIDAIIAAHRKSPRGKFGEAFRAHADELNTAVKVDWRSGDLDAKQKAAVRAVMEAHGIDVAGAFKRMVENLIESGRYDVNLSPKTSWDAIEPKEQSEWASRARWRYAVGSDDQKRALCELLVAAYKDNARAHAKVGPPSPAAKSAKTATPMPCKTRPCDAVLMVIEPSTADNREVQSIRKELEARGFKVRVVNASDTNESELQTDVVVKIFITTWQSGMSVHSSYRNSYEAILPKLDKRNKWDVAVPLLESADMSAVRRFVEAQRSVVPWILENLVP